MRSTNFFRFLEILIVGKVYHCTWSYWPVQRVACQIEVKWVQYTYSRGYLPRFLTVFFQTRTPAIIRVLRRACTVTLSNDVSGRGGGLSNTSPARALWGPCPDGMQMHKTLSVADRSIETYRAPTTVRVSQRCVLPNLWALCFGPAGSRLRELLTLRPGFFSCFHQPYCPQPHTRRNCHY